MKNRKEYYNKMILTFCMNQSFNMRVLIHVEDVF